jgi:hypothetical protein
MAARVSMTTIISKIRELINDTSSATWTDDQIQDTADRRRVRANYHQLIAEPTKTTSGTSYLTFTAPFGDWETDAQLYDGTYATDTADTEDHLAGRWTFVAEPDYPMYLVGWSHDVYGVAADLLEMELSNLGRQYDFAADGGSYTRSQKYQNLRLLADQYRNRSRTAGVKFVEQVRGDVNVW